MVIAGQVQHAMHHQMAGMIGETLLRRQRFTLCHAIGERDVAGIAFSSEGKESTLVGFFSYENRD